MIRASSILATGALLFAANAQAVNIAQDGIGEAAVAPYYSVVNGWWTLLQVTNTQDVSVAAKVHFREALNGRVVQKLTLTLSPFDVWTGLVRLDGSGAPVVRSTDSFKLGGNSRRSCTIPATTDSEGNTIDVPFSTAAFDETPSPLLQNLGLTDAGDFVEDLSGVLLPIPRNRDGGPTDIERTKEGWVEVISMGYAYANESLPLVDSNDVINVGRAIKGDHCDLVEEAFSETDNATTGLRRILETARQFGEPVNALKVNVRLLNLALGKESDIPTTHWANFYNPGAQLTPADELRAIEADLTTGNVQLDVNAGVLGDIGGLQLSELLRIETGIPGLDPLFDELNSILSSSGNIPPDALSCDRGTANSCGLDRDRFVFPEDNENCTITRDQQWSNEYQDWQPDGGASPDGLLRTLALGLEYLDPGAIETALTTFIPLLAQQTQIEAHSCRNLIVPATGLGSLEPSLNDAYPAYARFYHDTENRAMTLVPLASTPDDYNIPEDKRGIDAISLTLLQRLGMNEWASRNGTVNTDWITTMPTKPFYTDRSGDNGLEGLGGVLTNSLGVLDDGGEQSAISPRASAPILTAPFGIDLASPTARPESIRRNTMRASAIGSDADQNTGLVEAAVGRPAADPYPPFRESFGRKDGGDESTAASCNLVGIAVLDRTSDQLFADGAATRAVDYLSVAPYLLGSELTDALGLTNPGSNFLADLCYGTNIAGFSSATVLGSSSRITTSLNSLVQPFEPASGWAQMEYDLFGRSTTIDVGETAGLAPVALDPIASINEYPEDGASMAYFVQSTPTNSQPAYWRAEYMRGLPTLGFAVKERVFGNATRNYVSTSMHSFRRGYTNELPDQPTLLEAGR